MMVFAQNFISTILHQKLGYTYLVPWLIMATVPLSVAVAEFTCKMITLQNITQLQQTLGLTSQSQTK
jgi:hypothetical protein